MNMVYMSQYHDTYQRTIVIAWLDVSHGNIMRFFEMPRSKCKLQENGNRSIIPWYTLRFKICGLFDF